MKLSIIDIGTQSVKHYIFEQNNLGRRLVYYKRYSEANLGEHHEIMILSFFVVCSGYSICMEQPNIKCK